MVPLDGTQTRQLIDTAQVLAVYRSARADYVSRFKGAMTWKSVGGRDYLYRKVDGAWKSLGPRSAETELTSVRFKEGQAAIKARRKSLGEQIRRMAPVNRAMRLGRVPLTSARVLRKLDEQGLLGRGLQVAGTHALYAYEMMAGVHFDNAHVATTDIDLLFDARSALNLASAERPEGGLIGVLRAIDPSFAPTEAGSFRAANDKGFLVDLITPAPKRAALSTPPARIGQNDADLLPVEIAGLAWLESSPSVEQTVIDEAGFPLAIVAPDPRAFAIHKLWLSKRDDREPIKRRRDGKQAVAVIELVGRFLPHLAFDDPALAALPAALRDEARAAAAAVPMPASEEWE